MEALDGGQAQKACLFLRKFLVSSNAELTNEDCSNAKACVGKVWNHNIDNTSIREREAMPFSTANPDLNLSHWFGKV